MPVVYNTGSSFRIIFRVSLLVLLVLVSLISLLSLLVLVSLGVVSLVKIQLLHYNWRFFITAHTNILN